MNVVNDISKVSRSAFGAILGYRKVLAVTLGVLFAFLASASIVGMNFSLLVNIAAGLLFGRASLIALFFAMLILVSADGFTWFPNYLEGFLLTEVGRVNYSFGDKMLACALIFVTTSSILNIYIGVRHGW